MANQNLQNNDFAPRSSSQRPAFKLSVKLIDTYKHINKVYYEEKAKRLSEQADLTRGGVHNDGYDDQHYDYILVGDEIINDRYILKHRIGKGSFGQVVCAYDKELQCEVAIKMIKSKRPFYVQAQTEIKLLKCIQQNDPNDESNIVRLLNCFVHHNHQCLVFEMLSTNLYELLKNTKFKGISLALIRKFSLQILQGLQFLASHDVDIVHCDLKPENILLKHPFRSGIKIIDFGSSCLRTQQSYSYIQSRFYRSPEILLGMKYDQKIDIWSLGCVLVELHIGQPLFGGMDQEDQVCRIIDVLGMPSAEFLEQAPDKKLQFFERVEVSDGQAGLIGHTSPDCDMTCISWLPDRRVYYILKRPFKADAPPPRSLHDILGVSKGGPNGRRKDDEGHSEIKYKEFLSFILTLLVYDPKLRASPSQALMHPYMLNSSSASASNSQLIAAVTSAPGPFPITDSNHSSITGINDNDLKPSQLSISGGNPLKRSAQNVLNSSSSEHLNDLQFDEGITIGHDHDDSIDYYQYGNSTTRARLLSPRRDETFANMNKHRIRSKSAPSYRRSRSADQLSSRHHISSAISTILSKMNAKKRPEPGWSQQTSLSDLGGGNKNDSIRSAVVTSESSNSSDVGKNSRNETIDNIVAESSHTDQEYSDCLESREDLRGNLRGDIREDLRGDASDSSATSHNVSSMANMQIEADSPVRGVHSDSRQPEQVANNDGLDFPSKESSYASSVHATPQRNRVDAPQNVVSGVTPQGTLPTKLREHSYYSPSSHESQPLIQMQQLHIQGSVLEGLVGQQYVRLPKVRTTGRSPFSTDSTMK